MSATRDSGYAPVNGMELYWERRGSGGTPLVIVHGGFGLAAMFGDLLDQLAGRRQVVAVELQGHGHTRDIDRPFSYEAFGDDIAALARHLELGRVDLLGYSLGGGAVLRATLQHPEVVRKLCVVSFPCRRAGWFPEVLSAFDHMGSGGFEQMRHSPVFAAWSEVAPDPDAFPSLMDKTGELQRRDYDWSSDVRSIGATTILVFGDADSIPVSHMAEFYELLGGGLRDAGWDGSQRPDARLAVIPGRTHYDVCSAPELAEMADAFFD